MLGIIAVTRIIDIIIIIIITVHPSKRQKGRNLDAEWFMESFYRDQIQDITQIILEHINHITLFLTDTLTLRRGHMENREN